MSHLDNLITDFVAGTSKQIPRSLDVSDILPDTLAKVIFTVKLNSDDADEDAVIQKVITTDLDTDQGQIDEVGGENSAGIIDAHFFILLSEDDTLELEPNIFYYYDIKVFSSAGAADVPEAGRILALPPITLATS
jgi:hypothetical protein